MVTATQSVNDETLQLLGPRRAGLHVQVVSPEDEDRELLETFDLEFGDDEGDEERLVRPVRRSSPSWVTSTTERPGCWTRSGTPTWWRSEAGGITQHIGAYQVVDRARAATSAPITFIDTPGHEAFTAMRARGAKVTDIVVLVVAADDGVMPQTVEALNHAQAAEVPIVVAVNKIDKEGADPAKVRQQLTEYGLVAEEYGGETMFVDVSATTAQGIDELLEAVLLTADAALDLRANTEQDAAGRRRSRRTLDRAAAPWPRCWSSAARCAPGDSIVAGDAYGRVRALLDEHGNKLEEALPSRPVQVARSDLRPACRRHLPRRRGGPGGAADRRAAARPASATRRSPPCASGSRLEDLDAALKEGEVRQLNLIIKGDDSGYGRGARGRAA